MPAAVDNFEFIQLTFADGGNKEFPDTIFTALTHRVSAAVPEVEFTHDGNPRGVRCPDGKTDTLDVIQRLQMCAEFFVWPQVRAFCQQPDIQFLQQCAEPVRIVNHMQILAPADFHLVTKGIFTPRDQADKETAIIVTTQFRHLFTFFYINNPDLIRIRQQGTHFQPGGHRMHTQKRKRISVVARYNLVNDVLIGKYRHVFRPMIN
ncbi:hypothetical protein SRABI106_01744 [Rahnella aquatilis]|nr:hypothetical protein SRABI106_01744 [Rahnella aquatilis]